MVQEVGIEWISLKHAICHQNLRAAQFLLEHNTDIFSNSQHHGARLLLYGLKYTSVQFIEFLMDCGAEITGLDEEGRSAVHWAAANRQVDVLQFVLDQGCDIDSSDHQGLTALHYAVMFGELEVCDFLLKKGANVNRPNGRGDTPLTLAVSRAFLCRSMLVRLLLQHGANVNNIYEGTSILHFSVNQSDDISVKFIIQQMARMVRSNLYINECDRQLIQNRDYCRKHYEVCVQELDGMKKDTFYNNVTVFHMFTATAKAISGFARNDELIQALDGGAYETRFPLYFPCLKKKFDAQVERQKFRSAAAEALSDIVGFNDPVHIVNQKILDYLRDEDLKFLGM